MKRIDIYITAMIGVSTGVCFARERDDASHRQSRHFAFFFPLFTVDGHDLVLVFATTRRHLALRAARIIEQGVRHVFCVVNWGWQKRRIQYNFT